MDLQSLQFLLLLLLGYTAMSLYTRKQQKHGGGFRSYPVVGVLPDLLKNRRRFLQWSTEVLRRCPTHTATFWRPHNLHGIVTANPANVEHILKTNFQNYPKGDTFIHLLRDFLGHGIFNSDGDQWKLQRKTASHAFTTKSLRRFVVDAVTFEIQARLAPLLRAASRGESTLDLQDILERFAFDNVCKVAFNVDPACLAESGAAAAAGERFMRAFDAAATISTGRFLYAIPPLWKIKRILNVGSERRLREAIRTIHEFADRIIHLRTVENKGNKYGEQDLLSRFIETQSSDGTHSAEFLRDVVTSFILAGRDTTSSALTWFFWLLSSSPDTERKILHAAISEALRLYPPVAVDTRICRDDDVMPDGTLVRSGWIVTHHTYAMGRMERLWGEDCCEYRPERWLEGCDGGGAFGGQENSYKFPVFHAGPRLCLGKDMAYIQMKSVAAAVIEGFVIQVLEKQGCPDHVLSLTLRMKGGLPVTVRGRGERRP